MPEICITEIAANYIKQIKTIQPRGPYFLCGGSIGGLITFEVAQQLNRQGEQVAFLALIEPITPIKFAADKKILDRMKNRYESTKGIINESLKKYCTLLHISVMLI